MPKRVGLRDIAEALNVSITTVSRALNDKFDINPETKKVILEKAEELNYRPNAFAVSLRKNEYNTIGVILPTIDHYFFSTVLKGIMNKAHNSNYLVLIGESGHQTDKEQQIMDQFINHCVTGVIISTTVGSEVKDTLEPLRRRRIPFIQVDRPAGDKDDPYVRYDDEKGAFLATEHLIDRGFKKIALIKGPDICNISNARLSGYQLAMEKYNLPFDPRFVKSGNNIDFAENGYHLARQVLLAKNRPDAIFTITDELATGVYRAAKELNLRIPDDLGIVGYSNSKISTHLSPPLTTVEQPGEEMGEQAFDFLQQSIIGNASDLSKTFDARLIIRDSSLKSIQILNSIATNG